MAMNFHHNKIKAFLTVHSGPQPVMVSGLGTNFPKQRQIGFPNLLAIHIVPGPHGDGLQGSGFSMHLKCKSMLFGKKTEPNLLQVKTTVGISKIQICSYF